MTKLQKKVAKSLFSEDTEKLERFSLSCDNRKVLERGFEPSPHSQQVNCICFSSVQNNGWLI